MLRHNLNFKLPARIHFLYRRDGQDHLRELLFPDDVSDESRQNPCTLRSEPVGRIRRLVADHHRISPDVAALCHRRRDHVAAAPDQYLFHHCFNGFRRHTLSGRFFNFLNLFLLAADYHKLKFLFFEDSGEFRGIKLRRNFLCVDAVCLLGLLLCPAAAAFHDANRKMTFALVGNRHHYIFGRRREGIYTKTQSANKLTCLS